MSPAEIKDAFLGEARALGFDLCRMAPAEVPPHAEEFHAWLAEGRHGEMAWLEKNAARRTDPQLVLPGARTAIMLAMNYWQDVGADRSDGGGAIGKIAR